MSKKLGLLFSIDAETERLVAEDAGTGQPLPLPVGEVGVLDRKLLQPETRIGPAGLEGGIEGEERRQRRCGGR